MTDKERIDDAYERIDIDTDDILLALCDACDGERVERCVKSIWDLTVTMHQIATVALKENAKLRELVGATTHCRDCKHFTPNDEIWAEPPLVPITMIMGTCDTCDFWANTKCKVEPDGFCAWGEPRIEVNDD